MRRKTLKYIAAAMAAQKLQQMAETQKKLQQLRIFPVQGQRKRVVTVLSCQSQIQVRYIKTH